MRCETEQLQPQPQRRARSPAGSDTGTFSHPLPSLQQSWELPSLAAACSCPHGSFAPRAAAFRPKRREEITAGGGGRGGSFSEPFWKSLRLPLGSQPLLVRQQKFEEDHESLAGSFASLVPCCSWDRDTLSCTGDVAAPSLVTYLICSGPPKRQHPELWRWCELGFPEPRMHVCMAARVHGCMSMWMFTGACVGGCVCAGAWVHGGGCAHAHTHTHRHICARPQMCTHVHAHTHTHTHVHPCTRTCRPSQALRIPVPARWQRNQSLRSSD